MIGRLSEQAAFSLRADEEKELAAGRPGGCVWKGASRKTLAKGTNSAAYLLGLLPFAFSSVSSLSL